MVTIYTLKQAAEVLNMRERTIYGYVNSGELKASKIGGQWRILEADIIDFMKQNRYTPEALDEPQSAE